MRPNYQDLFISAHLALFCVSNNNRYRAGRGGFTRFSGFISIAFALFWQLLMHFRLAPSCVLPNKKSYYFVLDSPSSGPRYGYRGEAKKEGL